MNIVNQPSPHGFNRSSEPDMIIVHCMAEYVGDKFAPDFLESIKLSAHALVVPDGTVIRCREDNQGAHHAKGFNATSLGVEFLVPGYHDYASFLEAIKEPWVVGAQYEAGVELVKDWAQTYDIPREKVLRHSDVSPERKVDPGKGFPWEAFLADVFEV